MKSWKKLLLCIAISVLIATFIGTTLSVINNRVIVYLVVQEQEKELDSKENYYATLFMQEYFREENQEYLGDESQEYLNEKELQDKLENVNIDLSKMESILKEDRFRNMAKLYSMTAGIEVELYMFSIGIGVATGILIYLIFLKQIKVKKILLISVICFAGLFLIFNAGDIISDIIDGTFEVSNLVDRNEGLNIFMIVYIVIFIILYVVNLIHQKRLANKLNSELNKIDE